MKLTLRALRRSLASGAGRLGAATRLPTMRHQLPRTLTMVTSIGALQVENRNFAIPKR